MVNYSGTYATPRPDLGAAYQEFMDDPAMSQFIANQVAPIVETPVLAGKFSAITRESALAGADARRGAGSAYNRVDMGAEDKSFECEEFGLEAPVDDRKRRFYQNDFDHQAASLLQLIRKIRIEQERRMATLIQNTTTWTGAPLFTDVSAAPWDTAGSDVIGHVLAAKEKVRAGTGMKANSLILSEAQFQNLLKNTGIIARFPGSLAVTEDVIAATLARIFGLQRIIRGGAVRNTANEAVAATLADIWSDDYAMVAHVCDQGAPIDAPAVARTFLFTPDSPTDLVVEQYREEQVRAEILRARHDVDEVVMDAALGHLLKID